MFTHEEYENWWICFLFPKSLSRHRWFGSFPPFPPVVEYIGMHSSDVCFFSFLFLFRFYILAPFVSLSNLYISLQTWHILFLAQNSRVHHLGLIKWPTLYLHSFENKHLAFWKPHLCFLWRRPVLQYRNCPPFLNCIFKSQTFSTSLILEMFFPPVRTNIGDPMFHSPVWPSWPQSCRVPSPIEARRTVAAQHLSLRRHCMLVMLSMFISCTMWTSISTE